MEAARRRDCLRRRHPRLTPISTTWPPRFQGSCRRLAGNRAAIAFGVLTTDTIEQAVGGPAPRPATRSAGEAVTAIETNLFKAL